MKSIQDGNHRKAVASWRQELKQQWRKFSSQSTNEESLLKYHTNAAAWTCGCETYLLSRFLLCKHVVSCYQELEDSNNFFKTVLPKRTNPYWVQPQFILRPEFQPTTIAVKDKFEKSDFQLLSDYECGKESEGHSDEDLIVEMDEEPMVTYDAQGFISKMDSLIEIFTEQHNIGNSKFTERLVRLNASNLTLWEEIEERKRRHT